MKKNILTLLIFLILGSYSYANPPPGSIILPKDKKEGRYFEDQPDVNDDFQFHIIYSLYKDSKDKEGDINGAVEKLIEIADQWIAKTTAKANKKSLNVAQNIKWDRRKDGKLDISFLRFNFTAKQMEKCKWSCGNVFGKSIIESGFDNPKKMYLNIGDFKSKLWHYSGGFPVFHVFTTYNKSIKLNKKEVGYFILHEGLHAMGGIYPCSPNFVRGHNTENNQSSGDLMASQVDSEKITNLDPKNDDYWAHDNETCPDMQDSVYFTPTSDTPFDPFEVTCLPKDKWKISNKKFENLNKREPGDQCYYTRRDLSGPSWVKELGVINRN